MVVHFPRAVEPNRAHEYSNSAVFSLILLVQVPGTFIGILASEMGVWVAVWQR
jgi:hypothetical protein